MVLSSGGDAAAGGSANALWAKLFVLAGDAGFVDGGGGACEGALDLFDGSFEPFESDNDYGDVVEASSV